MSCPLGSTWNQGACKSWAPALADVSVKQLGNVLLVTSDTVFNEWYNAATRWSSLLHTMSQEDATAYAVSALWTAYRDVFDFVYVFPCERVLYKDPQGNRGANWVYHGEACSGCGFAPRADGAERVFKGRMQMNMIKASAIPMLHELSHRWNQFLPSSMIPNNRYWGHWGLTALDKHGQSGGYSRPFIRCADPPGHEPSADAPCAADGSGRYPLQDAYLSGSAGSSHDGTGACHPLSPQHNPSSI